MRAIVQLQTYTPSLALSHQECTLDNLTAILSRNGENVVDHRTYALQTNMNCSVFSLHAALYVAIDPVDAVTWRTAMTMICDLAAAQIEKRLIRDNPSEQATMIVHDILWRVLE